MLVLFIVGCDIEALLVVSRLTLQNDAISLVMFNEVFQFHYAEQMFYHNQSMKQLLCDFWQLVIVFSNNVGVL